MTHGKQWRQKDIKVKFFTECVKNHISSSVLFLTNKKYWPFSGECVYIYLIVWMTWASHCPVSSDFTSQPPYCPAPPSGMLSGSRAPRISFTRQCIISWIIFWTTVNKQTELKVTNLIISNKWFCLNDDEYLEHQ